MSEADREEGGMPTIEVVGRMGQGEQDFPFFLIDVCVGGEIGSTTDSCHCCHLSQADGVRGAAAEQADQ